MLTGFFEATFGYIAMIAAAEQRSTSEKSHGNKQLLHSSLCNSTLYGHVLIPEEPCQTVVRHCLCNIIDELTLISLRIAHRAVTTQLLP